MKKKLHKKKTFYPAVPYHHCFAEEADQPACELPTYSFCLCGRTIRLLIFCIAQSIDWSPVSARQRKALREIGAYLEEALKELKLEEKRERERKIT